MAKKLTSRLLATLLLLAVCAFATQGVAHSHDLSHDEDNCTCQVCHIGHAAIPQTAHSADSSTTQLVAWLISAEQTPAAAEAIATPSIPRAPPA